jgi:TRAP-type mannitol/chloroaromatic compound transport system substrate-binding protein
VADRDPFSQEVYASYSDYLKQVAQWSDISEYAFMRARNL